jgi:hypothetical protein
MKKQDVTITNEMTAKAWCLNYSVMMPRPKNHKVENVISDAEKMYQFLAKEHKAPELKIVTELKLNNDKRT